jgi:hypothetical protein
MKITRVFFFFPNNYLIKSMEEDLKLSMEEVKEVEMEIKLEYLIMMMMVAIYMVPLLVKMFRFLYLMLLWCLRSKKMHRSLHTKGSRWGRRLLYGVILVKLRGVEWESINVIGVNHCSLLLHFISDSRKALITSNFMAIVQILLTLFSRSLQMVSYSSSQPPKKFLYPW